MRSSALADGLTSRAHPALGRAASGVVALWLATLGQATALAAEPPAAGAGTPKAAVAVEPEEFDVVVYGGTSGGVMAAAQVAMQGKEVALIEPGKHLGGMTSGGLATTDIKEKAVIGGLARNFYTRLGQYYKKSGEVWNFEPHFAEKAMNSGVGEVRVTVVRSQRLDLGAGVEKQGARIISIRMESGRRFAAKMFIDASYEGDLMAKAGVSYRVGREANSEYDETLDGAQPGSTANQFKKPVDPYVEPGKPVSGLLPEIEAGGPGRRGEADSRVQAYNFRMCLTDAPENQLPFPKPAGYDPRRYELLLRYIRAGVFDVLGGAARLPNGKTDIDANGAVSTDHVGANADYPDGDYATRKRIFDDHVAYQQGMMYFLANDPRVPEATQKEVRRWGLCKDEFTDFGGWSWQLYVREARRMKSDYVMTQHHCQGRVVAEDSIGLAPGGIDSRHVRRIVLDGYAHNEGEVQAQGFKPYPISYRAIVPKASECVNLLVPVCLSATHIAYASIRKEPVLMVLGQSAGTAACQAIDHDQDIQKIDVRKLQRRLTGEGQALTWTESKQPAGGGR